MASYSKTLYSTLSENGSQIIQGGDGYGWSSFTPNRIANTLYVSTQTNNASLRPYYTNNATMWFPFNNIPKNKLIKSCVLHFYVKSTFDEELRIYGASGFRANIGWNSKATTYFNGINSLANSKSFSIEQPKIVQASSYENRWTEIDSHLTSNNPYLVVTYEDVMPNIPTQLFPSNVNLDSRTPIKFSWKYSSTDSQIQSRYEMQYSINNQSTWTTVGLDSNNRYHDFPASTFPVTGTIHWKIRTRDSNNLWSGWSVISTFTTSLTPQNAPKIISPTSGYLNGSDKIKLSWEFKGGADYDVQAKYEVQYSINGASWVTISNNTSLQYHIFEEDLFGSGRVNWKVRTFNNFNNASDFSGVAYFNVISRPPIPQIQSITNSSRPKISWISVEQQYYRIKIYDTNDILIYEHKEPSVNKFHDIKIFLDDGDYKSELVIFNQYNLYSEIATSYFTISTVKPELPVMRVYSGEYSNTIQGDVSTQITRVYRDNIFIGRLDNNTFIDYTCENKREYSYFLRSINDEESFSDSEVKLGRCSFRSNTLSTARNPGNFVNLSYGLDDIPEKVTHKSVIGSNFYFDGREYPVTEFTEFKSTEKSLKFFVKEKAVVDKIGELIDKKQTLLYRDIEGENIYGTILSLESTRVKIGYNIYFAIAKIDYRSELDA